MYRRPDRVACGTPAVSGASKRRFPAREGDEPHARPRCHAGSAAASRVRRARTSNGSGSRPTAESGRWRIAGPAAHAGYRGLYCRRAPADGGSGTELGDLLSAAAARPLSRFRALLAIPSGDCHRAPHHTCQHNLHVRRGSPASLTSAAERPVTPPQPDAQARRRLAPRTGTHDRLTRCRGSRTCIALVAPLDEFVLVELATSVCVLARYP